ncbi:MAG: winged helix-turn-helix domain-containing protein [Flavobacteriales bacterium]|nr:winged helix-turn-helix domain-containing protein [Flavobacteriales bacterium]
MYHSLWNRQAVRELIQRRYDRKLAIRSVGLYLESWRFMPQKPSRKAYELRPEAVRKWLQEDLRPSGHAQSEGAVIHWGS